MHTGNRDGSLHELWHTAALGSVAGRLDGALDAILVFAIGGQHLTDPLWVVVADVTQVARHGEDEVVARAVDGYASELVGKCLNEDAVGDAIVGLFECDSFCLFA